MGYNKSNLIIIGNGDKTALLSILSWNKLGTKTK